MSPGRLHSNQRYPEVEQTYYISNLLPAGKKEIPASTLLAARGLVTLGVKIVGNEYAEKQIEPFKTLEDYLKAKQAISAPPAGNVPRTVTIDTENQVAEISGRLVKGASLSHDPNIGGVLLDAALLRKLG